MILNSLPYEGGVRWSGRRMLAGFGEVGKGKANNFSHFLIYKDLV
jgi:hypothetical protein